MFFSQEFGVSIKQFLLKMGNEIAYLMPTNYKIFLGKGALTAYNQRQGASPTGPTRTLCAQTVLPIIQNGMTPLQHKPGIHGGGVLSTKETRGMCHQHG